MGQRILPTGNEEVEMSLPGISLLSVSQLYRLKCIKNEKRLLGLVIGRSLVILQGHR